MLFAAGVALGQAQAPSGPPAAGFPLTKSCGASESIATVGAADSVKVRYSFFTDVGICYAVTTSANGKSVDGFLMGNANPALVHPGILAFEQEVRLHAAAIPPPPPPAPPAPPVTAAATAPPKPPQAPVVKEPPPTPLSFAGFRATDINGDRVDLSARHAPNVVLYFWSARTARSAAAGGSVEGIYESYHSRGVDVVGIASAANASQLWDVCRANEVNWPQVFDSGGIASRYHVDMAKPFLLLDQSRKVIAAAASASEIEELLGKMMKNRRAIQ